MSKKGSVSWKSPSNIAIVKYWGKHGRQLPKNTSLSFTLSNAHTITSVDYSPQNTGDISLNFKFEGQENEAFKNKIVKFLKSIADEMPILKTLHFDIKSENSFPHSSGIASSASAMSALSICLCDIERILDQAPEDQDFLQRASYFSRLGSGSASRSVYPDAAIWGAHSDIAGSSDLYATVFEELHDNFKNFHDDILIISAEEKSVSSTAGHGLMNGNPFAEARYQQANDRVIELIDILKKGNINAFGKLAEDEAMTLHALMMCSDPSYVLIKPNTLLAIERIRKYRKDSGVPVYFTLDAGPNIHLLYPDEYRIQVEAFISVDLMELCVDGRVIKDVIGKGAEKIQ